MVVKDLRSSKGSPKVEVGEIETRVPFLSVKDAVTLFGEGAFSGEKPIIRKPKEQSTERVLAKETQLHLAQNELNKLKEQLKNAETTKTEALAELEKAKKTVQDLSDNLRTVCESRESAIKATESAFCQAKQFGDPTGNPAAWKQELEAATEQYIRAMTELDGAKQELSKVRQECNASLEAEATAFKQAVDAENAAKANIERANSISNELSAVQESIEQVKFASVQAQQELAKIYAEKDKEKHFYKSRLDEIDKKLFGLKEEFDPELTRKLEAELTNTFAEIGKLQAQMEDADASDLELVRNVASKLDDAKRSLRKVVEEENSLRNLVESLKVELENVKKEHSELKEKDAEAESVAGDLHLKLRKCKCELESRLVQECKARDASDEMISTLHQLSAETENERKRADDMKREAEELKKKAEATRVELGEAEKKLKDALEETEEEKAAEARALDQIKILSGKTSAARASTSESGAEMTISKEEFESLNRKVKESDSLAEMRIAAAMAQVEAVKASENETLRRMEATRKEIEEMKLATRDALRRAEMAETAKRAVEGELRKWREQEQKKAAEAAFRALAETEKPVESSPRHYKAYRPNLTGKILEARKLEKGMSLPSKKALLPNISGFFFHRKKNQIEGGSPSYLPGEKPL